MTNPGCRPDGAPPAPPAARAVSVLNTPLCFLPSASSPLFYAEGTAYTSSASGFVGASGPAGTVPVTTTTPPGTSGG